MTARYRTYDLWWALEARTPEQGWVAIADGELLRASYDSHRHSSINDWVLIFGYITRSLDDLTPTARRPYTRLWPADPSHWVQERLTTKGTHMVLDSHTIPTTAVSFGPTSPVGGGAWPRPHAATTFVERVARMRARHGLPPALWDPTTLDAPTAHSQMHAAQLARALPPLSPDTTRLLLVAPADGAFTLARSNPT